MHGYSKGARGLSV